jgi:hypothetical protein
MGSYKQKSANMSAIVGMYSLFEDEYAQMAINTTKVVHKPEQRLVTIEVFHQLHCLVSSLSFIF